MQILIADDQLEVRAALRLWLTRQSNIQIVGEAAEIVELVRLLETHQPDLLLIDWELPGLAADLVRLRMAAPNTRIVVLSGYPEARSIALSAGADSFISKSDSPEFLLSILQHFDNESDTSA